MSQAIQRRLLVLAGAVCLVLTVGGILLPAVPATPFVLAASYCFLRSAPAWDERLRRAPFFGRLLRDWHDQGGVRLRVKVSALVFTLLMLLLSLVPTGLPIWARVFMVAHALVWLAIVARLPQATASSTA
jgi:uncharacterized membrane protein YbaN (DUF454 family)